MENISCKIGEKAENILLYTSIKISENFNTKHLRWSKADLPKEKKILRKDTLGSSVAAVWGCTIKKVPLKNCHLFIGISLKFMIFITFKTHDKTC